MQDNDELKLDGNTGKRLSILFTSFSANLVVPRATALYLPIYLFKPNNLACAFLNSDYNEAYHFSSKNGKLSWFGSKSSKVQRRIS